MGNGTTSYKKDKMNNQIKEHYDKICRKCNQITPHKVVRISLLKGLKLQCLFCGNVNKRYIKIKNESTNKKQTLE